MFFIFKIFVIGCIILLVILCNLAIVFFIYVVGNGVIDWGMVYVFGFLVIIVLGLVVYLVMVIIELECF